jgi:hypothetical protein
MIVYKTIYPELSWLFERNLKDEIVKTGYGNDSSIFAIPCSRWSGAPNTSLGNTLTNLIFLEMVKEKYSIDTFDYLVEGDDALFVTNKKLDADEMYEYAKQNGFDLKFEQRERLDTAGFLSMKWFWWNNKLYTDVFDRWAYLRKTMDMRPHQVQRVGYWPLLAARLDSATRNISSSPLVKIAAHTAKKLSNYTLAQLNNWWDTRKLTIEKINFTLKSDYAIWTAKEEKLEYDETLEELDQYDYGIPRDYYNEIKQKLSTADPKTFHEGYGMMMDAYYMRDYVYPLQEECINQTNMRCNLTHQGSVIKSMVVGNQHN